MSESPDRVGMLVKSVLGAMVDGMDDPPSFFCFGASALALISKRSAKGSAGFAGATDEAGNGGGNETGGAELCVPPILPAADGILPAVGGIAKFAHVAVTPVPIFGTPEELGGGALVTDVDAVALSNPPNSSSSPIAAPPEAGSNEKSSRRSTRSLGAGGIGGVGLLADSAIDLPERGGIDGDGDLRIIPGRKMSRLLKGCAHAVGVTSSRRGRPCHNDFVPRRRSILFRGSYRCQIPGSGWSSRCRNPKLRSASHPRIRQYISSGLPLLFCAPP